MNYDKINLIYFSATATTAKIARAVADGVAIANQSEYNITCATTPTVDIPSTQIAVFAMPVYSGRIPQIAAQRLRQFTGHETPAIIVCVYGNREFDDALVELEDVVQQIGFKVVAAGAFVAQHSIFPTVAGGRPDENDVDSARQFGSKSADILSRCDVAQLQMPIVAGARPYRAIASIPLRPKTDRRCNACAACASQCPMHAIDAQNPRKIDKTKCISCAHCIAVCPKQAKHFGGLLYKLVSKKFAKKCVQRREPYTVFGA